MQNVHILFVGLNLLLHEHVKKVLEAKEAIEARCEGWHVLPLSSRGPMEALPVLGDYGDIELVHLCDDLALRHMEWSEGCGLLVKKVVKHPRRPLINFGARSLLCHQVIFRNAADKPDITELPIEEAAYRCWGNRALKAKPVG